MRLSYSPSSHAHSDTAIGLVAALSVDLGQSENFEQLADILKDGLEQLRIEGCFLTSCFGLNRETRFGDWSGSYVFPLRSDLTEVRTSLNICDDLVIAGSGYFTLVVGHAAALLERDASLVDALLMLAESVRYWVKGYTHQVDREFESVNQRKAVCKQLLEIVKQLDASGNDATMAHKRVISAINAGVPENIRMLSLSDTQQSLVMDEFDEVGRAYSVFTRHQMELNSEIKEKLRSVAGFLLAIDRGASGAATRQV